MVEKIRKKIDRLVGTKVNKIEDWNVVSGEPTPVDKHYIASRRSSRFCRLLNERAEDLKNFLTKTEEEGGS